MNFLPFFVKKPKLTQRVELKSIEITGFPAGDNPFIHDGISSGVEIRSGIMGMSRHEGDGNWPVIYITNPVTGQRFLQVPVPVKPEYQGVFSFDLDEPLITGVAYFNKSTYDKRPTLNYVDPQYIRHHGFLVHTGVGGFQSPLYVVRDKYMVLWEEALHRGTSDLRNFIAEETVKQTDDIPYEIASDIRKIVLSDGAIIETLKEKLRVRK